MSFSVLTSLLGQKKKKYKYFKNKKLIQGGAIYMETNNKLLQVMETDFLGNEAIQVTKVL